MTSSAFINGEYIGTESCEDLVKNFDSSCDNKRDPLFNSCRRRRMEKVVKKEFPPPITLLARTENLPAHMPWVLRRRYTDDGRLILTEEKVRHHEYFLAHRSNGRLTLELVPLDDEIFPPPFVRTQADYEDELEADEAEEDDAVADDDVDSSSVDDGNDGDVEKGFDDREEQRVIPSSMETGIAGNGTPIKCSDYSVSATSGYIFGVPLPAIRPVQR